MSHFCQVHHKSNTTSFWPCGSDHRPHVEDKSNISRDFRSCLYGIVLEWHSMCAVNCVHASVKKWSVAIATLNGFNIHKTVLAPFVFHLRFHFGSFLIRSLFLSIANKTKTPFKNYLFRYLPLRIRKPRHIFLLLFWFRNKPSGDVFSDYSSPIESPCVYFSVTYSSHILLSRTSYIFLAYGEKQNL